MLFEVGEGLDIPQTTSSSSKLNGEVSSFFFGCDFIFRFGGRHQNSEVGKEKDWIRLVPGFCLLSFPRVFFFFMFWGVWTMRLMRGGDGER